MAKELSEISENYMKYANAYKMYIDLKPQYEVSQQRE
jgi:hypothetical protein